MAITSQPIAGSVAYLLKAFPRASEPFIASEIYWVEQSGLPLRLFVTKPVEEADRSPRHPVADRIRAVPEQLPIAPPVSGTFFPRWLATNLPRFLPSVIRVTARWPLGVGRAVVRVVVQVSRTRKKAYVKEFLQAAALADRLRDMPDVKHLHAHYGHSTATIVWLAGLITGLPFSFTGHARDIYCDALNPARLLERKLAAARFVVTCTDANRRHLQAMANGTPVHCVYHGPNADFSRLVARGGLKSAADDGTFRVLGVGRLVRKKGFDVLIQACAILHRGGVPLRVRIVGPDGGQGEALAQRISALGLEGIVELAGALPPDALADEYAQATAFCLPCRVLEDGDRDGIPNVLVEAMACGLPVVTTGISGIPELVVDALNGLVVPGDSPAAVAEALLRLYRDPSLAHRLSREARSTVRARFDGESLSAQLVRLFRSVAA